MRDCKGCVATTCEVVSRSLERSYQLDSGVCQTLIVDRRIDRADRNVTSAVDLIRVSFVRAALASVAGSLEFQDNL